jgi:hypothetical protein
MAKLTLGFENRVYPLKDAAPHTMGMADLLT